MAILAIGGSVQKMRKPPITAILVVREWDEPVLYWAISVSCLCHTGPAIHFYVSRDDPPMGPNGQHDTTWVSSGQSEVG